MRHHTAKSALIGALFSFFFYIKPANADSLTAWIGGTAPCPTCWSTAGNWSPSGVPNNNVSVTINAGGSQPILDSTANGFIVDNLTLGSGALLQVANGQTLGINTANTGGTATILNNGGINLNSTGGTTSLNLYGTNGVVNLNQAGELTLSNNAANQIVAISTGMTLNNNSYIQGSGSIGVAGSGLILNNHGLINANLSAGFTVAGTVVNTDSLEATNASALTLQNGTLKNTGATIFANGANTTINLNNETVTNTNGTIGANGAGSSVQLNGATIINGSLGASGGGVFNSTGTSAFKGAVTLNATLNVINGSVLQLSTGGGTQAVNGGTGGAINLNSNGSFTDLSLTGTGGSVFLNAPVTLSNSANNRIYANNTGMTLYNGSTIQGGGQIGAVGSAFTLNNGVGGIVNANAGTLLLYTPALNIGLLEATNGGTLSFGGQTITNTGGTISAIGTGSVVAFNGTTVSGGTLQASGGGQFLQSGSNSTLTGTVALNGVLNVANASSLTLDATSGLVTLTLGTGGALNLNSTGSYTDLILTGANGTVNLNGPLTLSSSAANRIYANNAGMTLNNNSTITGAGRIGADGQPLTFNNNGTVNANQSSGLSLGGTIVNAGLLEATNGSTLTLQSGSVNNTGSTISANGAGTTLTFLNEAVNNTNGTISAIGAGSSVQLSGSSILGGTLQGSGGGQFFQSGSNTTLAGTVALNTVLSLASASSLTLDATSGPMTLNGGAGGALKVNSTGSYTDLILTGFNGTVNLNAPLTLSSSATNRIYANNTGMTLNSNSTITGAGRIGADGQALTFNNNGTVNANQSGGLSLGGSILNAVGLLEATNGSTLTLQYGSVNNTGSTISANGAGTSVTLLNEAVNNTGGTISAIGAGSSVQLSGSSILGGTLQGSGGGQFMQSGSNTTLAGAIAFNGALSVANASSLTLDATGGQMTLNGGTGGALNLNSTGSYTDLILTGINGTVNLSAPLTLSNSATNRIYANNTGMTLNNNSTITGAGRIGADGQALTLINNGTVNANQSGGLIVGGTIVNTSGLFESTIGSALTLQYGSVNNTGSTISANGAGTSLTLLNEAVNNTGGTISAIGPGSSVQLTGSSILGGTLQASGGGQFTQSGSNTTLAGAIALNGALSVANASSLTLNATNGPMTLNGGTGGALSLNSTGSYTDLILAGYNGTVNLNAPLTLSNGPYNRIYANNTGMTLNNSRTISGAGEIAAAGYGVVFNNNVGGVIIASQSNALMVGGNATFTNLGTLQSIAGSTLEISGPFTNFSGDTLTGGTYVDGGIIQFNNANIVHNAAGITMIGATAMIEDQNGANALLGFNDNTASGTFTLEAGSDFAGAGAFNNAGYLDIFADDLFAAGPGSAYTQTGGTTQVDGTLTAGAITIGGGHLKGTGTVNGNVTVTTGGAVDPGDSPGTLSIHGNYTQSATGALDLEIAGSGAGQFDVLNISGIANLNGTLNLASLAGLTFFSGETFDVVNFASRNGTFSTVNGLSLGNGFTFQVEYNATDVLLVVNGSHSTPEPASWVMFATGLAAIGFSRILRKTR